MAGHQLPPAERRRAKLTQVAAEELRCLAACPQRDRHNNVSSASTRSGRARSFGKFRTRPGAPRPADTPPDRPQASASNLQQVRKPSASRQILSRRWDANNRVLTGTGEALPDRNEEAPSAWTRTTIPVPAAQAARPNGAAASSAGPPRTISRAHISPPSPTTPPTTSSASPSRGSRSSGRASSTYQRSTSPCTSSSRSSSPPIPTPPRRKPHPRHGRRRRRKPHPRRLRIAA